VHSVGIVIGRTKEQKMEQVDPQRIFPQFSELHEDLMINILSYIADVPFEVSPHSMPRSTVTGVLPLVCRQFNDFCKSTYFWRSALERLRVKDSYLWEEGLQRMIPTGTPHDAPLSENEDCKALFRRIVDGYIKFSGPVFYMTGRVRIGQAFGLHFFEPRYRLLIQEVMADWPPEARQGSAIAAHNGRFPTFIYANVSPLAPTTPACLVQVSQVSHSLWDLNNSVLHAPICVNV